MLDKAFRAALRNFATLFLLVCVVALPLHLVYSVVFANVIETREIHDVIETFPEARQVRGVGTSRLTQARIGLLLVTLVELGSLPFLARGTKRILETEREGEMTTVTEALESIRTESTPRVDLDRAGPVVVAAVASLLIGFLVSRTGLALLEFVSDARSFPFYALVQAVARAAGAPFLLAAIVCADRTKGRRVNAPTLY